jgi:hypothetical protein
MSATAGDPRVTPDQLARFQALVDKDIDAQVEFFLKSFIFALGDDWKKVVELSKTYAKCLSPLQQPPTRLTCIATCCG